MRVAAVKALASFAKEEDLPLLCERALCGLASLCSHEELEVFLNRHDQELCAGALVALDNLLYMPEWLKVKERDLL